MEPLSILGGVVAVAQAGEGLSKLLRKLSEIKRIPNEIHALNNDITDLRLVLNDLLNAIQRIDSTSNEQLDATNNLKHLVEKAKSQVDEIETLVKHCFNQEPLQHGRGRFKINRLQWLRQRDRLEHHRLGITNVRELIILQLAALSCGAQAKTIVRLEDIVLISSEYGVRLDDFERRTLEQFQSQAASIALATPTQAVDDSPETTRTVPPLSSEGIRAPETGRINARSTDLPPKSFSFLRIRTSYFAREPCSPPCMCSCHARRMNAPIWHPLLGYLFFSYRGSPIVGQGCDSIKCHNASAFSAYFTYQFPLWFMARAFSCAFIGGLSPVICLDFPRILPISADLWRFIYQNDVGRLQSLLGRGLASPSDIRFDDGSTPLQFAINLMRVEVCEFLVSIGSNPFALSHSRTPRSAADLAWDFLQYASTPSTFKDAMRRLLPPPEDLDSRSFTRLHEAVLAVSKESVESLLLIARSYVNVTDSQGRSPLWWAAQKGDVAVVDHLLRCGADPDIGDTGGRTPLHEAAGRGDGDIVESLLSAGADPNVKDEWGDTPLQRAGMALSTGTISRLLKHGVDIHSENIYGQTVLATVATHRHVSRSLVTLLLDHDANVEHRSGFGNTVLLTAIANNAHAAVALLLEKGADITVVNTSGATVLHRAAHTGDAELMALLSKHNLTGLDWDAQNAQGETATDVFNKRGDTTMKLKEGFLILEATVCGTDIKPAYITREKGNGSSSNNSSSSSSSSSSSGGGVPVAKDECGGGGGGGGGDKIASLPVFLLLGLIASILAAVPFSVLYGHLVTIGWSRGKLLAERFLMFGVATLSKWWCCK